jgi:hypothetical protein
MKENFPDTARFRVRVDDATSIEVGDLTADELDEVYKFVAWLKSRRPLPPRVTEPTK